MVDDRLVGAEVGVDHTLVGEHLGDTERELIAGCGRVAGAIVDARGLGQLLGRDNGIAVARAGSEGGADQTEIERLGLGLGKVVLTSEIATPVAMPSSSDPTPGGARVRLATALLVPLTNGSAPWSCPRAGATTTLRTGAAASTAVTPRRPVLLPTPLPLRARPPGALTW